MPEACAVGQVKLFNSSTFSDMHAERDFLNLFVYPAVRSACRKRRVDFSWIDFRWGGVTHADTQEGLGVLRCLDKVPAPAAPSPPPGGRPGAGVAADVFQLGCRRTTGRRSLLRYPLVIVRRACSNDDGVLNETSCSQCSPVTSQVDECSILVGAHLRVPFLVGLLGERIGWIPEPESLPRKVRPLSPLPPTLGGRRVRSWDTLARSVPDPKPTFPALPRISCLRSAALLRARSCCACSAPTASGRGHRWLPCGIRGSARHRGTASR